MIQKLNQSIVGLIIIVLSVFLIPFAVLGLLIDIAKAVLLLPAWLISFAVIRLSKIYHFISIPGDE